MVNQTGRWLWVGSPLGDDVLIGTEFSAEEAFSAPFSARLVAFSERQTIDGSELLGKGITVKIQRPGDEPRIFHGLVCDLAAVDYDVRDMRRFEFKLAPWFWFLNLRADLRIFENKSAVEIIQQVFEDAGYQDYSVAYVGGSHPVREYCVQYRESDFAFVSRLMEEEGIFYFFTYEDGRHTMVLSDNVSAYGTIDVGPVEFSSGKKDASTIWGWNAHRVQRHGKVTRRDYDFKSAAMVESQWPAPMLPAGFEQLENYDYPGGAPVKGDLDALTRYRIEEPEASFRVADGQGSVLHFQPGATFAISDPPYEGDEEGTAFVLDWVRHTASDSSGFMDPSLDQEKLPAYENEFRCMPRDLPFRPQRLTAKPVVGGVQTAVVVGPEGEEIYCDQYGRIRVRFYWDRKPLQSCWVRVAHLWAGSGWGSVFIPRVGMEVVVGFYEGDPDRPLVMGCVYNGRNMPPYALPDNASQAGLKTHSTKGGGGANYNELRFEDKIGQEQVLFHAERDFRREVEHDDSLQVGHDQSIVIQNNRTEQVVDGNETVVVKTGDRSITVSTGDDSLTVSKGDHTTMVSSGKILMEACTQIELKVGGSTVKIEPTSITISSTTIKIEGEAMVQVQGAMVQISGDGTVQVTGGLVTVN